MIVACDVGYGHVKQIVAEIMDGEAHVVSVKTFPSLVKRIEHGVYGISDHPDYVEREGKTFLVGRSADTGEETRVRDSHIFLNKLPVLLARAAKYWTRKPELLVLGTPFQEWKKLSEEIVKETEGFADEVRCFPQAAAAAVTFNVGKSFLVCDIGFNTVDMVPVDDEGRVLADRGVSWDKSGVSKLLSRIRDHIRSVLGAELSPLILEQILVKPVRIKSFLPVKDPREFQEMVRKLTGEYAFELMAKIVDRYGKAFNTIAVVGGGARVVGKDLRSASKVFGFKVLIAKDPEYANVKGFLSLGLATKGFSGRIVFPEKTQQKTQPKKGLSKKEQPKDRKEGKETQEKPEELEEVRETALDGSI